jgi:hypothetical protein
MGGPMHTNGIRANVDWCVHCRQAEDYGCPGGIIVSWPLELDSSPCASLASTCLGTGMGMAAGLVVLDSVAGMLAATVSCAPPISLSSALPCSCTLGTGSMWCLSILIDFCQDITVVGVNPTTRPTPPLSC